ncbi:AbrB/MazE/SpoVT family DNA-binding domain-containing protein [Piscirickettsia litoralis]|uniref:Antidote-toxin recognition MazE family protein n=1 Tax=Piscirickettsia litoralis TaxID=1891921 RepID=A0ABX2ZZ97_9GAMM|nr:AbrB/MazE/SpoVT family DNA-binding domain-containing protein [Piscirickettsia litoralis]ODN41535.1 antidote-toxin recognition MazE family protein [Piscirickettsia litoralis]
MAKSRIFKSGNSQAVRLPKEMRLDGDEVIIHRLGDALLIQPVYETWLDVYNHMPDVSDDFMEERQDIQAQERDWF